MRVRNISGVAQKVRGIDGVVEIQPGMSKLVTFSEDGLARARQRSSLEIESDATPAAEMVHGLVAKHRGGGSYSVMDDEGKEHVDRMSKDDADAFNAMSEEDKAAFVAKAS